MRALAPHRTVQGTGFKKIIIITAILLVFVIFIIPFGSSAIIYENSFTGRYETYKPLSYSLSDFEGLRRTRHTFTSSGGQTLVGYYYTYGDNEKGIVVVSHGLGGGGQERIMDVSNYFAKNGYGVFAYDATANDESGGEGIGGLPQGIADLNAALDYIEGSADIPKKPIVLWGHSWGAYSADAVLKYHPEVKAVCSVAGFNRSTDVIRSEGAQFVGNFADIMMLYIDLYEKMKFGEYHDCTALEGFEKSNARVFVIQGGNDTVIPPSYGYDIWKQRFDGDKRFKFKLIEKRSHDNVYYSQEAINYIDTLNSNFDKWADALDYDYTAEENYSRFVSDKEKYINENLDRERWCNMLDTKLFSEIKEFFDESIG